MLRQSLRFSSFWSEATSRCKWDIATLNYDTCIERSVACQLEDGYVDTGAGYSRFDPRQLQTHERSRILHLHGCILYGYLRTDMNRYRFEDEFEDLYKYNDASMARATWFGRSSNTAQSHEEAVSLDWQPISD
ncbi:SIR2 family protein [Alicyclobacillus herbarius]|uniref:SIR2 family protein n=1 Tax=Alicyclobacillus herbarius TaxID=122960 RepID=UPI0012DD30E7